MNRVYLDHHAATPLLPSARAAMLEAHEGAWANAASPHAEGRAARARLELTRASVAGALGVRAADVVLTGGGTEACNLGVLGLAEGLGARPGSTDHALASLERLAVITSTIEHPAIARAIDAIALRGARVHALALHEPQGVEQARAVAARAAAEGGRVLVAMQVVSHEVGTVLDVRATLDAVSPDALVVLDACQAVGKLPADRFVIANAAVAIGGAKIGASAGTGALVAPRCATLAPRLLGGQQERGRRAGTPDVAALAGLGAALDALPERLEAMPRVAALRDRLEAALVSLGGVVNGVGIERVASVTNLSFAGWRKATLVAALDLEGIAVSAGAACSSGIDEPSHVVRALHPSEPWRAESCVRFSLGLETSDDDVDRAIGAARRVLARRPS